MKIWTQNNSVEDALNLPEGSYAVNLGFWIQQSVEPRHTAEAAKAILKVCQENGETYEGYTQSELIVDAQNRGIAFSDWGELRQA